MEEIDKVDAYTLSDGDCILFDGAMAEIKEIREDDETGLMTFISEDEREISYLWFEKVSVFGYVDVDF